MLSQSRLSFSHWGMRYSYDFDSTAVMRSAIPRVSAVRAATLTLFGAALVGLMTGCGGSSETGGISASSVKQAYADELRPNVVAHIIYGIDPDQQPESSADNTSVLISLPNDRYELSVTNTGDTGFINEFSWLPPGGFAVTRIVSSSRGQCSLSASGTWDPLATPSASAISGSASREIVCNDVALAPPRCSCRPGATLTVDFIGRYTATNSRVAVAQRRVGADGHFEPDVVPRVQFGFVNGWVEIDSITPVPYKIPSYLGGESSQGDLPLCGRDQLSAHAKACVDAGSGG